MAQVAFKKNIGSEWVDVTTLATLTEDEVYYIQNRGAGVLLAQENNAEPTDEAGTVAMPYKVLKYTNNGKCWVKSLSGLCAINITDKNAPAPAPQVLWFPIEAFDSFTEEADVEGYDYYYDINAVATDGEDSYNIYYEQGVLPEVEYVSGVKFNNLRVSKNGSPVNASLYIRVQPDGSQDFLDFPIEDLTIEATSEYDCSWYSGSERFSKDSYNGTFVIEENADEEGHYGYVGGEVVKQKGEGEAEHIADSCTLYVKVTD